MRLYGFNVSLMAGLIFVLVITMPLDSFSGAASLTVKKDSSHTQSGDSKNTPKDNCFWTEPLTGMLFVWVPGGCYKMGCGEWSSDCQPDEKPEHEVCLDGYWIGKYEVTQAQWKKIMGDNPSRFKECGPKCPVEQVSWNDVKLYIDKLNRMSGENNFRLPTEAEWEYAGRSGGKNDKYSGGNRVNKVAWYVSNSGRRSHPVGKKRPNHLDIYDMSGNVLEWCEDVYASDAYSKHKRINPIYREKGPYRVIRGGSWDVFPVDVRTTGSRINNSPTYKLDDIGFRLVREAP